LILTVCFNFSILLQFWYLSEQCVAFSDLLHAKVKSSRRDLLSLLSKRFSIACYILIQNWLTTSERNY
jgi:hypothetical protein